MSPNRDGKHFKCQKFKTCTDDEQYIWTNERTCSACFKLWWTMKSSSWNGLDYNETFIANTQISYFIDKTVCSGGSRPRGRGGGVSLPWGPPPPPPLASPVDPPLVCFFNDDKIRLDVRESKIVLDSGFYVVDSDARCWTPDLCQWALDSGIPILRGILDF